MWGSNATGCQIVCKYCDKYCIDDNDEGPSSHELVCTERFIAKRLKKFFGISNLPKMKVINISRKGLD